MKSVLNYCVVIAYLISHACFAQTGNVLIEQAKAALLKKVGSHYSHMTLTAQSMPKDRDDTSDDLQVFVITSYPISKRVCVWLEHKNNPSRIAVWFKVSAYARVLVANHHMRYNTAVQNEAFSWKERNIAGLRDAPRLMIPHNMWLTSSIERGTILLKHHLKEQPLVVHGQHINVAAHHHSITVVMKGIALADGYLGDEIHIKNAMNHNIIKARISGPQYAEISS